MDMRVTTMGAAMTMATLLAGLAPASAQTLGTFSWQLAPYCNVISVTVTQNGSNYTLDGYDNQCGGSTRAAVVGMAVPNPTGTVTLGFAIVTPPNATPVHVTTAIDLGSLGGSWSDDQGNTGTFVFTPSGVGSGSPRPAALNGLADNTVTSAKIVDGAIGGADINAAEIQKRVSSVCPSNQLMISVNQDGTVVCQAVTSGSGGDITGVAAGTGLSGGGATGDVTVQANFAEIQARVASACPANQTMRSINADGTVVCDIDNDSGGDISAVNAGTGLTGGGGTGDVTVGIAIGGVTTAYLGANAVDASKVLDGSIGAAEINPTQVQTRVTGICPAGQAMRTITQTGTVTCEPITGGAGGDITAVNAGLGLTGGGTFADVTLSVDFGGDGTLGQVARADHEHSGLGTGSVAVGPGALAGSASTNANGNTAVGSAALRDNQTGSQNTAVGQIAMRDNATGSFNVAVGAFSLTENVAGTESVAVGYHALENAKGSRNTGLGAYALILDASNEDNTAVGYRSGIRGGQRNTLVGSSALEFGDDAGTGNVDNTAVGYRALYTADGDDNTAVGARALQNLTSGDRNIALGLGAGGNLTAGSDNLYIASGGLASESETIRIGVASRHTRFFANAIRGITTDNNNAQAVMIDSAGQLGTTSSSRKTKFDITDLDPSASAALQHLRPVQFRYLKPFADGSTPIQYGLIAEEVQEVLPELVVTDEQGDPASVKYHILPSLLLAEVQRLERERAVQNVLVHRQGTEIAQLRDELQALRTLVDDVVRAAPRR
jgi:Chaperone of endosialidase